MCKVHSQHNKMCPEFDAPLESYINDILVDFVLMTLYVTDTKYS